MEMEKSLESRIEFLDSKHVDNGRERLPTVKKGQIRALKILFQTVGRVFPTALARIAYKIFATPRWRARHKTHDDLMRAAVVSDFSFEDEIIKIYDWNLSGECVVLLAHGWESRGTALRMYVPKLIEKGFRVVAFDAVAHGDSTGEQNNFATNARTIAALSAHFGGFYAAIGHSFGCTSLVYALRFMNISKPIERLVFLAVPHASQRIMESYLNLFHAPTALRRAFLRRVEAVTGRSVGAADVAAAYSEVKVGKLLLIHDRRDEVTSIDAAERVVVAWSNAHLIVTDGYGHFRIAKNPDVIRRIVEFVEN